MLSDEEFQIILNDLKEDEGFSTFAYKDTLGFNTIGYGTKMPLKGEENALLIYTPSGYTISEENAQKILTSRLNEKIEELKKALPWLKNEPFKIKRALINMSYQMGTKGVLGFKQTLKLIEFHNYAMASAEMMDSLWAKQTPNRAKKISALVEQLA